MCMSDMLLQSSCPVKSEAQLGKVRALGLSAVHLPEIRVDTLIQLHTTSLGWAVAIHFLHPVITFRGMHCVVFSVLKLFASAMSITLA